MDAFSAVVVSNDRVARGVVQKVLEDHSFEVETCDAVGGVDQILRTKRFDLAIYDNDVAGAMQLAAGKSTYLPKMAFALVRSGTVADVHGKRIHFIVQKPFSADLFLKSLKAAFGSMLRQKRQSFRHSVQIVPSSCVSFTDKGSQELRKPMIIDISETGMCLQLNELLTQGAKVQVAFEVPEVGQTISVGGLVMWVRASGRTGVRFGEIMTEHQKMLNEWLSKRLQDATALIPRQLMVHNVQAAR
jgi:DNA-binding response OmpR family regulator